MQQKNKQNQHTISLQNNIIQMQINNPKLLTLSLAKQITYQSMINNIDKKHTETEQQRQWNRRYAQEYEQQYIHKKEKRTSKKKYYEQEYNQTQESINQEDFAKFQKAFQSFIRKGKVDPKYKTYEKFFMSYFSKSNFKQFEQNEQDDFENQYGYCTSKDIKFTTIQTKLDITKQQAENGTVKKISYNKIIVCQTCNGKVKVRKQLCRKCGGSGWIGKRADTIVSCHNCYGNGQVKIRGCKTCKGRGSIQKQSQQFVTIPKGINNNQTITLKGRGNQHPRRFFFGDLFIKIKINNRPFVTKNGYDTHSTLSMSISQAVLGNYIKYHTYYGDKMVNIPGGHQDGDQIKMKGEGLKRGNGFGNHFINIKVEIPKKISNQQKKIYEELRKLERLNKQYVQNEQIMPDKEQQQDHKFKQQQQEFCDENEHEYDEQQEQFNNSEEKKKKNLKNQSKGVQQQKRVKNKSK